MGLGLRGHWQAKLEPGDGEWQATLEELVLGAELPQPLAAAPELEPASEFPPAPEVFGEGGGQLPGGRTMETTLPEIRGRPTRGTP